MAACPSCGAPDPRFLTPTVTADGSPVVCADRFHSAFREPMFPLEVQIETARLRAYAQNDGFDAGRDAEQRASGRTFFYDEAWFMVDDPALAAYVLHDREGKRYTASLTPLEPTPTEQD